jgi:hypothetical protein
MSNLGAPNSLFKEYQLAGLTKLRLAQKGKRVPSLALLREYIFNAAPPVSKSSIIPGLFANLPPESRDPALYINRPACPYHIVCLESAEADPLNPDDLPLSAHKLSHGIDSLRYGLTASIRNNAEGQGFTTIPVSHGPSLETQIERYLDHRKNFGIDAYVGRNHPLYKRT